MVGRENDVGPGGDLLALAHTRNHFREDWYPTLFNRQNYDNWAAKGKLNLRDRARKKINRLLAEHQPEPLPKDVAEAVQAVIDRTVESS